MRRYLPTLLLAVACSTPSAPPVSAPALGPWVPPANLLELPQRSLTPAVAPSPARADAPRAARSRPSKAPRRDGLNWAALRRCESTNNYRAVNPSGKYRGAYQFDRPTWAAYGPPGDPAAASPAEQDRRARALYAARGRAPWPKCGRLL